MAEDLLETAATGDLERLQMLIDKDIFDSAGPKAVSALMAAGAKNHVAILNALSDWGTPLLTSRDLDGRLLLHVAATAGAELTVQHLLEQRADVGELDTVSRKTAMQMAIKAHSMGVVKILLQAGAELPPDALDAAPGLVAIVREVRMESVAVKLREVKDHIISPEELMEADDAVWIAMRRHMHLIQLREEIRAGESLDSIEQRKLVETDAADRTKLAEEALAADLGQHRVSLTDQQSIVRDLNADVHSVRTSELALLEEASTMQQQIDERHSELSQATNEREASLKAREEEQQVHDETMLEHRTLLDELSATNARKTGLEADLQALQEELSGWQRDKETAAKLTAQAQALLGNSGGG